MAECDFCGKVLDGSVGNADHAEGVVGASLVGDRMAKRPGEGG
jgi:hypothetical protein